ncbi:aldo/keto reductase [Robiginitomaculum antarcticum]|uniref:aldo/keto reductase n=1 Tax=Robiginitomaculum antarcticum TaxID=437507 RepID=UPI000378AD8A|nr:aldo/keto reductase [Robiginitomaculum antarcticum]
MKTITLGQSDLRVGRIGYGCWRMAQSTPKQAQAKIETALSCGMTLIDTADIYGFSEPSKFTKEPDGFGEAEAVLGQVLKSAPQLRDQMILVTKGGIIPPRPYNSTYDYLTGALERSLVRLNTDCVDLFLIHRPDLSTSFAQAGRALDALIDSGKTRYVGISNFTASQAHALQMNMESGLIVHQNEFSALCQDPMTNGILDQCQERDMTLMAWSPLAGGALATGRIYGRFNEAMFKRVMSTLMRLAEAYDTTPVNIALAFTLRHPAGVMPIIGTQKIDRIKDSANADNINLTARDFYDLIEARRGEAMP